MPVHCSKYFSFLKKINLIHIIIFWNRHIGYLKENRNNYFTDKETEAQHQVSNLSKVIHMGSDKAQIQTEALKSSFPRYLPDPITSFRISAHTSPSQWALLPSILKFQPSTPVLSPLPTLSIILTSSDIPYMIYISSLIENIIIYHIVDQFNLYNSIVYTM